MRKRDALFSQVFARFLLVGAATMVLYLGLLYLSLDVLGQGRRLSVSIAYAAAVTFHFFSNRHFSFAAEAGALVPQVARYLVMVVINYVLTLAIVELMSGIYGLSAYWGAIASVVATTLLGYLFSKLWIFRVRHEA